MFSLLQYFAYVALGTYDEWSNLDIFANMIKYGKKDIQYEPGNLEVFIFCYLSVIGDSEEFNLMNFLFFPLRFANC